MDTSIRTCNFCSLCQAKYTCPRCLCLYCSSKCYASQQHEACAEIFYRNCVLEELKSQPPDTSSKRNVVNILKRDADSEKSSATDCFSGEEDLARRFDGIDFEDVSAEGTADLLARLTADERSDFENMISSGSIASLIPDEDKSEPWWINFQPVLLSEELDSVSSGLGARRDLVNRLPLLSAISGREPSPHLKYCLMNVVISYCYTCRLFNGDHLSCADEFLEEISLRSPVVRDAFVFCDTGTALQDCLQTLVNEQHISQAFVRQLFEDVKLVIADRNTVLELLSHVWFVIHECLSCASLKAKRKDIRLLSKKIEYFIAWTKERGHELEPLVQEIDLLSVQAGTKTRAKKDWELRFSS